MDSLDVAIENLYKAFSDVPTPRVIHGCPCCIDDKEVDKLLATELRSLSADELTSYASSAFLTVGEIPDYLYFLPRILEISATERWWWPHIEVTGRAIREAEFSNWSEHQQQALTDFFSSEIKHLIASKEYDELDGWMCGAARAGLDVRPFLNIIESDQDAVFHYFNRNAVSLLKGKLSNHFWEPSDDGRDAIIEWFRSEKVAMIYSQAAEQQK